jgi:heme-degrading monooxygenase HmoA
VLVFSSDHERSPDHGDHPIASLHQDRSPRIQAVLLTKLPGGEAVLIILFRSKLTGRAGDDYQTMNDEMQALVRQNPGFIDVKSHKAEDGERLTVVWWRDEESLREWRNQVRHRMAQKTGREKWYEYYKLEVASVIRESEFERQEASSSVSTLK